jgi:hypothetical protein
LFSSKEVGPKITIITIMRMQVGEKLMRFEATSEGSGYQVKGRRKRKCQAA